MINIPHPQNTSKTICIKTLIAQRFYRKKQGIIKMIVDKYLLKTKHSYCKINQRWTSRKAVIGVIKNDGWFWPDNPMMWKIYWPYGILTENKS